MSPTRGKLLTLLFALAVATGLLAGCGGSGGDDGGDSGTATASVLPGFAPADSAVYVEGVVHPEGSLSDDIDSLLGKFPNGDQASEMLVQQIDDGLAKDGLTYSEDIKPWLGQHAAFFLSDIENQDGAVLVETTDEGQALESIRKALESQGPVEDVTIGGLDGIGGTGTDGRPFSVVATDGVVIGGTETGVTDALAAHDGASFAEDPDFAEMAGSAGDGTFFNLFFDLGPVLDFASSQGQIPAAQLDALKKSYGAYLKDPILASGTLDGNEATIEFSAPHTSQGQAIGEESSVLAAIPDGTWAAVGFGGIGTYVDQFATQIETLGAAQGGEQVAQIEQQLTQQTGLSFNDFRALGDTAFFVGGTSLFELKVGAVIEDSDAGSRQRILGALQKAVGAQGLVRPLTLQGAEGFSLTPEGLPVPINFASADGKIVIAAGNDTTQSLLDGNGGFTDSDVYKRAIDTLGDGFALNFLLEFGPLAEFVGNTGQSDPGFERARPYLDAFDFVTFGSGTVGSRDVSRFVVGFKD